MAMIRDVSSKRIMPWLLLMGVLAIAGAIYFWPQPTPESVSKRALECLLAGDFDGVRPYVQDNIRQLGLTEGQARQLVEKYIGPRYAQLAKDGEVVVESHPKSGSAIAIQRFRLRGHAIDISTSAHIVEDGVALPFFIDGNTIQAAILTHADLSQKDKRARILRVLEKGRAELEALGLRGLLRGDRLITWDEMIADRQRSLRERPPEPDSG